MVAWVFRRLPSSGAGNPVRPLAPANQNWYVSALKTIPAK
jgi:hypothetical protein